MSDSNSQYEDEQDDQEQRNTPVRKHINALEAKVKEQAAMLEAGAAAQREMAFIKAGVDTSAPAAKYFVSGYTGDLTPEAIRAEAAPLNLVTPQADPLADSKAALGRMADTAKAGIAGVAQADFATRISNAKNRAEYDAIVAQSEAETNL